MDRGKEICKVLKDVRRRIAEENDIAMDIPECTFKGECRGTCPRCEAELRYLDSQLRDRRRSGRAVKIAGIAAGALLLLSPLHVSSKPIPDPVPVNKTAVTSKSVAGIINGNVYYRYNANSKKRLSTPFVTIKNMRTGKEVKSDRKGNFSIGASVGDILRISDFGYKTRRYVVKSLNSCSIELKKRELAILGEVTMNISYPDFKDADIHFRNDSIEMIPMNIKGEKVVVNEMDYFLDIGQQNSKGEIEKHKFIDFDVNKAGNILIHVDEILDNVKPVNGRYPSEVIIILSSYYHKNELKKRITIPEALIRSYRSGKARR